MKLLASVFLGWSLGANDAANIFGTAVSSRMVRWRTAAVLIAVFALAGALLEGREGMATLGNLHAQDLPSAFRVALAAAVTTTAMTVLRLPVSTSQAVVGAILGLGLARGQTQFEGLGKIVACWIGTPLGAMVLGMILYPLLAALIRALRLHFLIYDRLVRTLLVLAGIYGAYALGANNVANVTGVFYSAGAFGNETGSGMNMALLLGGSSIALGALTFSRRVMTTVGSRIVALDAFSSFVVVVAAAATVHAYAVLGVPVSSSQAVVGAVIGIGMLKGMRMISGRAVLRIAVGWVLTPALGALVAVLLLEFV